MSGGSFTDPESNRKAFAERLRLAMRGRFTQDELAAEIGASVSGVKKWLSGASDPGWSSMVAAAKACAVSLDWLATGSGPVRPDERGVVLVDPVEYRQTDHRLTGRLVEKIAAVYKEMNVAIPLHQVGELAATAHDQIVATVADPDDRLIEIGMVIERIRQELRVAAADPASAKRRA